jgi:hypothetical protein
MPVPSEFVVLLNQPPSLNADQMIGLARGHSPRDAGGESNAPEERIAATHRNHSQRMRDVNRDIFSPGYGQSGRSRRDRQ